MTSWKVVHGDVYPASPDTTSSAYTVYLRRNIQEETIDEMDGSIYTGYVYEEMTYTRQEWEELHSPAQVERMQKLNDIELAVAMI